MELENKLKIYYIIAILSLVFAVIGFSYNAWRLEVTEDNSNIRTASFKVLGQLAELEQIIFAAHYDKDMDAGNPRKGWVKVGLIVDLSVLISKPVEKKSLDLKETWSNNWQKAASEQDATIKLTEAIDQVRNEIKQVLGGLN